MASILQLVQSYAIGCIDRWEDHVYAWRYFKVYERLPRHCVANQASWYPWRRTYGRLTLEWPRWKRDWLGGEWERLWFCLRTSTALRILEQAWPRLDLPRSLGHGGWLWILRKKQVARYNLQCQKLLRRLRQRCRGDECRWWLDVQVHHLQG